MVFALVNSRADANQVHFYRQANRLFVDRLPIESLIEDIRKKAGKFYSQDKFKEYVDELFDEGTNDDRGFSEWPHLEFFLFEYENFLREYRTGEALVQRDTCSFERIYFSRGNDLDIYRERQALGGGLADQVIKSIGHDWANTVFSFIPKVALSPP